MRMIAHLEGMGAVFFRRRGSLPTLLLLPVLLASLQDFRYSRGSHAADLAWEIACFFVVVLGLTVRFVVSGTAPEGTSGRNTERQRADELNTTGLYAVVRHPLYLGNFLIWLGISLHPGVWYVPVIVALIFVLYYERVILAEERFLEGRFGDAFRVWAEDVPAFFPRRRGYVPSRLPFSWRAALRREFYGLCLAAGVFAVLDVLEDWAVLKVLHFDPLWAPLGLAAVVAFFVLRALKKRTRLLRRDGR